MLMAHFPPPWDEFLHVDSDGRNRLETVKLVLKPQPTAGAANQALAETMRLWAFQEKCPQDAYAPIGAPELQYSV